MGTEHTKHKYIDKTKTKTGKTRYIYEEDNLSRANKYASLAAKTAASGFVKAGNLGLDRYSISNAERTQRQETGYEQIGQSAQLAVLAGKYYLKSMGVNI